MPDSERRRRPRGTETALVKTASSGREDEWRQEMDYAETRLLQAQARFERLLAARDRHAEEDRAALTGEIVTALLPTLDSLRLAMLMTNDDPILRDGLLITSHELSRTFGRLGVETHSPAPGDAFDPRKHEAVSREDAPGAPEGMILNVLREGYSLGSQLLRPALVTVASGRGSVIRPGAS
jgi:molecular chaperone GrpE